MTALEVVELEEEVQVALDSSAAATKTFDNTRPSVTAIPIGLARDAKILDIFEGTQQIQLLIVARRLLGKGSGELK